MKQTSIIYWTAVKTSFGDCFVAEQNGKLVRSFLPGQTQAAFLKTLQKNKKIDIKNKQTPVLKQAAVQLKEYFLGKRKDFNLPLNPQGTSFQQAVWKKLTHIPFGKTKSYQDIAIGIKNEKAVRAVGGANNKNPLPIFVPCHRVIGKNGSMTGFGGGIPLKIKMLELENKN